MLEQLSASELSLLAQPDAAPHRPLHPKHGRSRADFIGPSTCTHLNDTLRAMEVVPALAAQLPLVTA